MGQYWVLIDLAAGPSKIPGIAGKLGECFWGDHRYLNFRLTRWATTPLYKPTPANPSPKCPQPCGGFTSFANELLDRILEVTWSEIDQLCLALTFVRFWNVYQHRRSIQLNGRPRMLCLGDYALEKDLPPPAIARYSSEADNQDRNSDNFCDAARRIRAVLPGLDKLNVLAADQARIVFHRINLYHIKENAAEEGQAGSRVALHARPESEIEWGVVYCHSRWAHPRPPCSFLSSDTPELAQLCGWIMRSYDNIGYYGSYGDDEDLLVLCNVDRKEFFLGSTINRIQELMCGGRRYLELAHILLILVCRSSDPSCALWISEEAAEAIVKGPWAGDAVEIVPLNRFLCELKKSGLGSQWRNVAEDIMWIVVELVCQDGELGEYNPTGAAEIKEELKIGNWPTIETLLSEADSGADDVESE